MFLYAVNNAASKCVLYLKSFFIRVLLSVVKISRRSPLLYMFVRINLQAKGSKQEEKNVCHAFLAHNVPYTFIFIMYVDIM
jgi:hypothetical protein